jgi:hypothetical protein
MPYDEKSSPDSGSARSDGQDDQSALERELQRESAEGAESIGDMRENRNVSGSSTWDTIADSQRSGDEGDRPEVF